LQVSALKSFVCPMDGLPLFKEKKSLRCEKRHHFDLAREGYCNLLLVQEKSSRDPGDKKEMVASRGKFLNGGHFSPVADRLFEFVCDIATKAGSDAPLRIVDAGCGEGYYLHRLKELAIANGHPAKLELAGFDISKWAVKAAAKRSMEIAWAVAGNRRLPFAPNSVDLILSMFGFPILESFKDIQSVGGHVLLVDPGADHLIELRKIIYPKVDVNGPPRFSGAALNCGYLLKREGSLRFSASLESASQIQDLLSMTPHTFRIQKKRREDLAALKRLTVSVDLVFRILQREV